MKNKISAKKAVDYINNAGSLCVYVFDETGKLNSENIQSNILDAYKLIAWQVCIGRKIVISNKEIPKDVLERGQFEEITKYSIVYDKNFTPETRFID